METHKTQPILKNEFRYFPWFLFLPKPVYVNSFHGCHGTNISTNFYVEGCHWELGKRKLRKLIHSFLPTVDYILFHKRRGRGVGAGTNWGNLICGRQGKGKTGRLMNEQQKNRLHQTQVQPLIIALPFRHSLRHYTYVLQNKLKFAQNLSKLLHGFVREVKWICYRCNT